MPERIRIIHSSMQNSDAEAHVEADLLDVLPPVTNPNAALAVTFGEAAGSRRRGKFVRSALVDIAVAGGWDLNLTRSDSAIAINTNLATVLNEFYEHVLDPRAERPGAYSARGVAGSKVQTKAGNIVTVLTEHLNTAFKVDNKPGPESQREVRIMDQVDTIIRLAIEGGHKQEVVFVTGDVNLGDQRGPGQDPDDVYSKFYRAGLVTCWDDAGKYPDTHGKGGKPIDLIARYYNDTRVQFVKAEVGPLRHSDHQKITAEYSILDLPTIKSSFHNCPSCHKRHRIAV